MGKQREELDVVREDSVESADWLKTTWDLPPYKSPEFLSVWPPERLPAFRKLPVYRAAVAVGLIHDDEWVEDWLDFAKQGDDDDDTE